jgi:hypothetical protein
MMPVVRINDATFVDLRTLKTWFGTKSPSETIDYLVKEMMDQFGLERDYNAETEANISADVAIEFETAPSLVFTKPLFASVNRKPVRSPRWSTILLTTIAQLKAKGFEGDKLVSVLNVPAKAERYEDEGYKYHTNLGISVQGQSASDAWKEIDRIAKKWSIPVTVEFWWRQNDKAQFPGRTGRLSSGNA